MRPRLDLRQDSCVAITIVVEPAPGTAPSAPRCARYSHAMPVNTEIGARRVRPGGKSEAQVLQHVREPGLRDVDERFDVACVGVELTLPLGVADVRDQETRVLLRAKSLPRLPRDGLPSMSARVAA